MEPLRELMFATTEKGCSLGPEDPPAIRRGSICCGGNGAKGGHVVRKGDRCVADTRHNSRHVVNIDIKSWNLNG